MSKIVLQSRIKNQGGVTLIELLVALGLFAVITITATQIFNLVVQAQRSTIASQNAQEDLRYIMEVVTKEIRMAQVDHDGVCVSPNRVYEPVFHDDHDNSLSFLNSKGQCVSYRMDDGNFEISRVEPSAEPDWHSVTSEETELEELNFRQTGTVPAEQPLITMRFKVNVGGDTVDVHTLNIQTSISARHYE